MIMRNREFVKAETKHKPDTLLIWALSLFALFSIAGAFSPAAKALMVLYPAGAFIVSILAYQRSKPIYVSLVCWLWFLSPCIRRIADYHSSGSSNAILLASFLSSCVPCLFMLGNWSSLISKRTAPVLYVLGGIFYGSFVSLLHYAYFSLAQALLAWLTPLFFALFLYYDRQDYKALYKSFEDTFLLATLFTGAYGIYQYVALAPWDAAWMINSDLQSIGLPEPYSVRVFGTMNSPQVFASFLVVGLLICFRSQSKLRFVAAPFGLAALILTMSRSGWLALAAGTLYLFFYLSNRQRIQLAGVGIVCAVAVGAAMQNSTVSDMVTKRFASFTDTKNDDSLGARIADYGTLLHLMSEEPFGAGIGSDVAGSTGESSTSGANGGIASRDSTITTVLLSMGWLGSLTFVVGILMIAGDIFLAGSQADPNLTAVRAVFLAMLAEAPLNNISAGPTAFVVWCAIGFCLAQRETVEEHTEQAVARMRRGVRNRAATAA